MNEEIETDKNGKTDKTDKTDTQIAIEALFRVGDVCELRVPHAGKFKTISGYFGDPAGGPFADFHKLAEEIDRLSGQYAAVYYTLNPVDPALLARANNCVKPYAHATTSAANILCYRWLLIDADPVRPAGISSTDAEKAFAFEKIKAVFAYLKDLGWATPLTGDSGNGYHLEYLIDLPNNADSTAIVKSVLLHLAEKFNDVNIKIDTTVFDPNRVVKGYGSLACKGDNMPERPHRYSHLRTTAGGKEIVTVEQLKALTPAPKAGGKGLVIGSNKNYTPHPSFKPVTHAEMEEGLEVYSLSHKDAIEITPPAGAQQTTKWVLDACIFNPEHTGDAAVYLTDGRPWYKCFHDSCKENKWGVFLSKLEADMHEKFPAWFTFKTATPETAKTGAKLKLTRLSDIKTEKIDWLWKNRVPFGMLTLFVGMPGVGKGLATMDIAARATTGKDWCDGKNDHAPIDVLIISSEDSASQILGPRLQAAGADTNRIIIHEMTVEADGGEKEFGLDKDLPALLEAFDENPNIKLVIIDPTSAHFGDIDENRTQEVRSALAALKRIIENKKVAVILVTHYNKMKEAAEHLDRIAGARGLSAACRVVWSFTDDGSGVRKMLLHKSNVMADPHGLEYEIAGVEINIDGEPNETAHIAWTGKSFSSIADELKTDKSHTPANKTAAAKAWLAEYMKSGEAISVTEIEAAAKAADIKKPTLDVAYKKLCGQKPFKKDFNSGWFWQVDPKFLAHHIAKVIEPAVEPEAAAAEADAAEADAPEVGVYDA